MNDEIKKEFIWRYKFIYENIEYIIGPFYIDNIFKEENDYIVNKKLPYDLLVIGQSFLLNDEKALYSDLVKYVEIRKRDQEYGKVLERLREKNNNKEYLMWQFFNSISNLLMKQDNNKILRSRKLKAMNEYYKILNYKNKEGEQERDSKFIRKYLNSNKIFVLRRIKEETILRASNFVKYLSNMKNYDLISMGILSDMEKQDIYLEFHDELAWDTIIKCEVDKNTIYKPKKKHLLRQDINPPCGEEFYLVESKIFINPEDSCSDYYQVCPNCGYVVNIPCDWLSENVRDRIEDRCLNDENEFSNQLLKAELKSIDYRDEVLVKRKVRKH